MIVPGETELSAPYWEGARAGELRLQWCRACEHCWHPPSPCCPRCRSGEVEWRASSGRGSIYSYTVVEHAAHPSFADALPYVVVLVKLEEGPRVIANLLDCEEASLRIGMPVRASFETQIGDVVLPQFVPLRDPSE
jgi:uncharacterized OB-fold protein